MEFTTDCKEWEFTQENIENKDFTKVYISDNFAKESIPMSYNYSFFIATPFKEKENDNFPINAIKLIKIFLDYYFPNKEVSHKRSTADEKDMKVYYYTRNYVEKCRKMFDCNRPKCYGIKDFYSLGD